MTSHGIASWCILTEYPFSRMPRRELLLETCEDRILCNAASPADALKPPTDFARTTSLRIYAHEAGEKPAAAASNATRHEIVFVDSSTQNSEQLVADLRGRSEPGTQTEVLLLD